MNTGLLILNVDTQRDIYSKLFVPILDDIRHSVRLDVNMEAQRSLWHVSRQEMIEGLVEQAMGIFPENNPRFWTQAFPPEIANHSNQ